MTAICIAPTLVVTSPAMSQRSGIDPMKAKAKMLQSHRDLILNYFRAKKEYSSGVVEGLNTKVKLVTRKAYGYRRAATIRIARSPLSGLS